MFKLSEHSGLKWLWLSAGIIIADLLTKGLALAYLPFNQPVAIFPSFNLTLVYNHGAAFSVLSDEGGWQRWFLSAIAILVSVMIIVWLRNVKDTPLINRIGLALILGGALGNLIDRLYYGYVIDFLDFHFSGWHFPAFNIADSAITCGAIALLLTLYPQRS